MEFGIDNIPNALRISKFVVYILFLHASKNVIEHIWVSAKFYLCCASHTQKHTHTCPKWCYYILSDRNKWHQPQQHNARTYYILNRKIKKNRILHSPHLYLFYLFNLYTYYVIVYFFLILYFFAFHFLHVFVVAVLLLLLGCIFPLTYRS